MTSIYRKLHLSHVFSDGDGGWVLKVTATDGELLELPLDLKLAARLTKELAAVVVLLAGKPNEPA